MDREKVVKGLECCKNKTMLWQHDQCPYHGFDEDCEANLHADALALLKEQEAVVRCKDCKYGIGDENAFVCGLKQLTAGMNWFCADGERQGSE